MANLSKQKRERMLQFLNTIKEEHKDDSNVLVALSEIETELQNKKYGLVWEKHEEQVDIMMKENIPVFTEVKEKEITADKDKPYNFLLEGDNLHSLKLLEKTHKGKIDVIYIDPPYNTGNKDFVYDDKMIDKNDGFSHSKWLSFMSERLEIAKNLLSEEGVIFISIDDNEQAQLKLLLDSILGEENFIAEVPRKTVSHIRTNSNYSFQNLHDYIIVYAKKKELFNLHKEISRVKEYKLEDEKGKYMRKPFQNSGENGTREARPNLYYPIFYNKDTKELSLKNSVNSIKILPSKVKNKDGRWLWSKEKFLKDKQLLEVYRNVIYRKSYFNKDEDQNVYQAPKTWFENYLNREGAITLSKLNLLGLFNYSKPVSLIIKLINMHTNKNSIVLDFFAGSGTTGHAVAELNKADGGNRKYILCTNNENNICEDVTYKRLTNIQKDLPHNLKYYKTDFLARNSEYLSDELIKHIIEMVQLEHAVTIDNNEYMLVLDDEESDALEKNISNYPNLKAIYVSKEVLLTKEQEEKFSHLDIHIIPDYYFSFELKEEGLSW